MPGMAHGALTNLTQMIQASHLCTLWQPLLLWSSLHMAYYRYAMIGNTHANISSCMHPTSHVFEVYASMYAQYAIMHAQYIMQAHANMKTHTNKHAQMPYAHTHTHTLLLQLANMHYACTTSCIHSPTIKLAYKGIPSHILKDSEVAGKPSPLGNKCNGKIGELLPTCQLQF